jgi:peroxiredoxin Q/BCP
MDFSQRIEEFTALWVQIVWVSRDSAESHCWFIANHGLKPFYLSDPELILHKQFGAYWEKNNYGKVVTGVIRSTFLLDQQWAVLQERKNVRAKGHAERILKEVR